MASGTDLLELRGNEKGQTHGHTYWQAEIRLSGLSGGATAPQKLSMFIIYS